MRWRDTVSIPARAPRSTVVVLVLVAVGLTNLLPGIALVLPGRLELLYGVDGLDADLLVLLRHRALLLALLGAFCLAAAFHPPWRRPALLGALLSAAVFVLLAFAVPTSEEITRVATVDLVALPLLVVGLLLSARPTPASSVAPTVQADVA